MTQANKGMAEQKKEEINWPRGETETNLFLLLWITDQNQPLSPYGKRLGAAQTPLFGHSNRSEQRKKRTSQNPTSPLGSKKFLGVSFRTAFERTYIIVQWKCVIWCQTSQASGICLIRITFVEEATCRPSGDSAEADILHFCTKQDLTQLHVEFLSHLIFFWNKMLSTGLHETVPIHFPCLSIFKCLHFIRN